MVTVLLVYLPILPEMLDKAVISRVQGRFKIDGARTEHDFLDQDHFGGEN